MTWDPRYVAVMHAKTAVQSATAAVDAATVARPFNMTVFITRLDALNTAGHALQAAHQTTQEQEQTA